ncbi:hypothetical protein MKW94_017552 [Papaver nudicaule]|uniref:Mitochondrial import inner membrane translocase subunit n=1 Tax=Papaver nudicaule TaxID=74823 RepID=A0AA41VI71_PAPNU|nr:hypothetical protein [Papaver nudicaule]
MSLLSISSNSSFGYVDQCVTSTPSGKFSLSESSCIVNCAQRCLDTSMIIMKRFQNMQQ